MIAYYDSQQVVAQSCLNSCCRFYFSYINSQNIVILQQILLSYFFFTICFAIKTIGSIARTSALWFSMKNRMCFTSRHRAFEFYYASFSQSSKVPIQSENGQLFAFVGYRNAEKIPSSVFMQGRHVLRIFKIQKSLFIFVQLSSNRYLKITTDTYIHFSIFYNIKICSFKIYTSWYFNKVRK